MAGLKDIDRRIKTSKNTQKTTYAMKLVSAAKLRKAQDAATKSKDYSSSLGRLFKQLYVAKDGKVTHPLSTAKESVKKVKLIVVGASKGLCGGYNSHVNKALAKAVDEAKERELELSITILGKKPLDFANRFEYEVAESFTDLNDNPHDWPLEKISVAAQQDFVSGDVDEVWLIYTKFKSAMSMEPVREVLLPLSADQLAKEVEMNETKAMATKFEPDADAVFAAVLPRIVSAQLIKACFDSKAGEQGSRMAAMDSATKNADELIENLTRTYNKLRQGAITAQILDIVGGAEAVK